MILYEPLCNYSATITKCPQSSEGVVQELFANLWHKRSAINEDVEIRSYLFKAARNRSIDQRKRKQTRRLMEEKVAGQAPTFWTPEEKEWEVDELIRFVNIEVQKLPKKIREVYELHRRDGLTYNEIAQVLGITTKAVEARMSKALKMLRSRLEKDLDPVYLPLLTLLI